MSSFNQYSYAAGTGTTKIHINMPKHKNARMSHKSVYWLLELKELKSVHTPQSPNNPQQHGGTPWTDISPRTPVSPLISTLRRQRSGIGR